MHSIFALLFIHLIAVSTPGPDTLVVIKESSISKNNGLFCIFGICLGVLLYTSLIILGLSAILNTHHFIHTIISTLGVFYLCWIGINLLKSKGIQFSSLKKVEIRAKRKSIRNGLLTNLSNPKAIIYFTSVFSQFKIQGGFRITLTIFSIILVTFLWFLLISTFINTPVIRSYFFKKSIIFDKISGAIFLLFSLILFLQMCL